MDFRLFLILTIVRHLTLMEFVMNGEIWYLFGYDSELWIRGGSFDDNRGIIFLISR